MWLVNQTPRKTSNMINPTDAVVVATGGVVTAWSFSTVNVVLAVAVAGLTIVLLVFRIGIAWMEWRQKYRKSKQRDRRDTDSK